MSLPPMSIAALADDNLSTSSRARGVQGAQPARSSSSHLYYDDLTVSGSSQTSPRDKTADAKSSKAKEASTAPKRSKIAATQTPPTAPEQAVPTTMQALSTAPTSSTEPPAAPTASTPPPTDLTASAAPRTAP